MKEKLSVFNEFTNELLYSSLWIVHVAYFFVFFNVIKNGETFINGLKAFIQIYICLILVYQFGPYSKTYNHLVFVCAMFLLLNLGISYFIERYAMKTIYNVPVAQNIINELDISNSFLSIN